MPSAAVSTRLEDYALIGDCQTAALVSRDGSIDWLCWPRFDSGACFAALVGTPENGRWLLRAADGAAETTRRYRPDTLILETRIETGTGTATVIDFMPPRGRNSDIVRLVRGDRGIVRMATELVIRFDYGQTVPWVSRLSDGTLRAIAGPDMVVLHTPVDVHGEGLKTVATFDVHAGQTIPLVLTYGESHVPPPEAIDPMAALQQTEQFWTSWCDRGETEGDWAECVRRSLITLKALTYSPTGGIVAAPTTSIPEQIGGTRNWDYRYCWLRDATLTLLAFMNAGYFEEARAWRDWLLRAAAGSPSQVQIMYGLAGERRLGEETLPWLSGYEDSQPVRIGNGAHSQLQLDVFGEVMDVLHQARRGGLQNREEDWAFQRSLLKHLGEVWEQPDEGIWETRGPAQHFTFSKIMAWVAMDRGIRAAEQLGLEGPLDEWRERATRIHASVCTHGFDSALGSFVQSYGSTRLDASLLLIPTTGFLPADDPRVEGTIRAIEQHLVVDGYVLRYDTASTDDGLPPGEGAFLACTFWLVDALVLSGRVDEGVRLFERLLALRNDVGLLSEEYDSGGRRLVGNFPQALSHIAMVNSAHNLARSKKPARQRASR